MKIIHCLVLVWSIVFGNELSNAQHRDKYPEYGSFSIFLGPDFPEYTKMDFYDVFYKEYSTRLNFGFAFYPLKNENFAFGGGFNFSMYSDDGFMAVPSGNGYESVDSEGTLSVQQYDLFASLLFSPFAFQRLGVGVKVGYSSLTFAETRNDVVEAADDDEDKIQKNEGDDSLLLTGVSLMIDITPLEETPVYSMIATLGIDKVYLEPFFTNYASTDDKRADWSSSSYGIMFGFEAMR